MNLLGYDGLVRKLLFMFLTIMLCGSLHAQADRTIRIRMLDSKTGQAVTTSQYMVWFDHQLGPGVRWVRQDRDGIGEMTLSPTFNAKVMFVVDGRNTGTLGYDNCDSVWHLGRHQDNWYAISDILTSGVVAPNYCSRKKAIAKPGEFVFFVRPMTLWEKFWANP
jgi:hypothetical protein